MNSVRCLEDGWQAFRERLLAVTGFDLRCYRDEYAKARAGKVATFEGCRNYFELLGRLDARPGGWQRFVGRLSIHVTEAFRDPLQWRVLQNLLAAKANSFNGLNCWSAGCSTGVEALSLAMLLESHFSGRHRILATDVDERSVQAAPSRLLEAEEVKNLPDSYRRTFLTYTAGQYDVAPRVRRKIEFRTHDLTTDEFERGFDLILCRNVAIYLADDARDALYRRLSESLVPGGMLFLGSAELVAEPEGMGLAKLRPGFYERQSS